MMKNESIDSFADNFHNYLNSQSIQSYLQRLSGQEKRFNVIDIDHNYAKPWNRHPDTQIRAKAAKFLFMKNFPKHFRRYDYIDNNDIDVVSVEKPKPLPAMINASESVPQQKSPINPNESNELTTPSKTGWTQQMHKIWTQSMKILQSDRLARLSYESLPNEVVLKRNLIERTATKFRHLFASFGWDLSIISWLNNTLNEYVGPIFLNPYHDAMKILRSKVSLVLPLI
jgi:regulatory NSL complex subunit 3